MKIEEALQIVEREWLNIRTSLEGCGDIGKFDSNNIINNIGPGWLSLINNIIEMEYKFPNYGYSTRQAAYVFAALASKAGERLGLRDRLSQTFGNGYSWIRTGWFDMNGGMEERYIVKQIFFLKLFFPLGGGDFVGWDFKSPAAMTKMKLVFDTFTEWQNNPWSYVQDIREYGNQIEAIRRGLSLTLNSSGSSLNNNGVAKLNHRGGIRQWEEETAWE